MNPTIGSQTANPTATPPQLQTLTAPPPKPQMPAMPMVPPQMNPTQAPPPPQMMRRGGLASLPMKMFKRANYAGGGIVAFAEGTEDMTAEDAARKQMQELGMLPRFLGSYASQAIETPVRGLNRYAMAEAQKRQRQMEAQDVQEGYESAPEKQAPVNQQASATTSGQIAERREPAKPLFGQRVTVTQPQIPELSDEQLFERRRKLQELAGVSADPYADIKKRYGDIEARRRADEEGDTMRSITAGLRGYAQAKATDPFGVQLAAAGDKMAALDKEQTALRDKQATAMAELQLNIAKEEDARKRGDVTAVEAARTAQQKAKMEMAELEIRRMNAEASMIQATRPAAEIQMIERVMRDKKMTFTEAAEYLQSVKGINALRNQADKEWNDNNLLRMEWEKKGGYPAYMASKGLSVSGGGASQIPKVTTKEQFDSLPSGSIYIGKDGNQYRKP